MSAKKIIVEHILKQDYLIQIHVQWQLCMDKQVLAGINGKQGIKLMKFFYHKILQ